MAKRLKRRNLDSLGDKKWKLEMRANVKISFEFADLLRNSKEVFLRMKSVVRLRCRRSAIEALGILGTINEFNGCVADCDVGKRKPISEVAGPNN